MKRIRSGTRHTLLRCPVCKQANGLWIAPESLDPRRVPFCDNPGHRRGGATNGAGGHLTPIPEQDERLRMEVFPVVEAP